MNQKINKNNAWILLAKVIAIAIGTLVVYYIASDMYTRYTTDKQIEENIQYCKDIKGYLIIATTQGGEAGVQVNNKTKVESVLNFLGKNSTVKYSECKPTGTAYIKFPDGTTLLPTELPDDGLDY